MEVLQEPLLEKINISVKHFYECNLHAVCIQIRTYNMCIPDEEID